MHKLGEISYTGKTTNDILSGKRLLVVFEISPNSVSGEDTDMNSVSIKKIN